MRDRQPKADRAAVIVHVERVAPDAERLRELVDDLGEVIERVGELLGRRRTAEAEARIVRRDDMVAVGEQRDQRFELP